MDPNTCFIEWDRLDMIAGGYTEDFIDICREFAKEMPSLFTLLDGALHANDIEKTLRVAHQIKGSAANFGFVGVSVPMEQIENAARKGSLNGMEEKLDRARQCFASACAEFMKKKGVAL